jgi:hypothetical protein
MDKPDYLSQADWEEWQRQHGRTGRGDKRGTRGNGAAPPNAGVTLDDFVAYMPMHNYIFLPVGELWPGASVNARVPPIYIGKDENGEPKYISAAAWLAVNRPVEQMTWAPGEPTGDPEPAHYWGRLDRPSGRCGLQPLPAANVGARRRLRGGIERVARPRPPRLSS